MKIQPSKIVVHNKRYKYHSSTPDSWHVLATYYGKDVAPQTEVPAWMVEHWKRHKSSLGYALFAGFTAEQALLAIALTKGLKAQLCIDRWGRVSGYKLKMVKGAIND